MSLHLVLKLFVKHFFIHLGRRVGDGNGAASTDWQVFAISNLAKHYESSVLDVVWRISVVGPLVEFDDELAYK